MVTIIWNLTLSESILLDFSHPRKNLATKPIDAMTRGMSIRVLSPRTSDRCLAGVGARKCTHVRSRIAWTSINWPATSCSARREERADPGTSVHLMIVHSPHDTGERKGLGPFVMGNKARQAWPDRETDGGGPFIDRKPRTARSIDDSTCHYPNDR